MFTRLAAIILISLCWSAYAQSPDSLLNKYKQKLSEIDTLGQPLLKRDSLLANYSESTQKQLHTLDSIQSEASTSLANLKSSYDSVTAVATKATNTVQHRIDSLTTLNLPTNKLTSKLDSIAQWKDEQLDAIQSKADQLKGKVNEKIQSLELPEELTEKSKELTSLMDTYDVTLPASSLPDLNVNTGLDIPNVNNPLAGESLPGDLPSLNTGVPDANLPEMNLPSTDISGVTGQVSQFQDKITGAVPQDVDGIQELAEKELTNQLPVSDVENQIADVGQLGDINQLSDEDVVKEKLKDEVKKQAVNHFAGKEEVLQKAMDQMSTYKKKYESIQSIAEIVNEKRNPLHDTPFIERLVPGITLQIQRRDAWMVDFNPYIGYRFNSHITAGLGWNQRIAYNFDINSFQQQLYVFGPRAYGEYKIGKGFSGHLEGEYMKTIVPSQFSSGQTDEKGREWVFSTMAGMKKEYRFLGKVKGTMMLLYNLYAPDHRSPYANRFNMRFGFEFPTRKEK